MTRSVPTGVRFRPYRGVEDIPAMLRVHDACRERDGIDRYSVAYRVPNMPVDEYAKDVALSMADGTDLNILIAEANGSMVGHCRLEWWPEWDAAKGERTAYLIRGWVDPKWRGRGTGRYFLEWGEQRAEEMDRQSPVPGELAANATDGEQDTIRMLLVAGYQTRFLSPEMAYEDFSNLPDPSTPSGYEVRQLIANDLTKAARAVVEANSPVEWKAVQLENWVEKNIDGMIEFAKACDPHISRIAWKDHEVAAVYLCRRKDAVGDVANVATSHRHRLKGLSRSLMFHCLTAMHDNGLDRARVFTGIGTDRDAPPEGPYKMYLGFGFKLLTFHNRYRKPMPDHLRV